MNAPKLRFKKFSDDWKPYKLEDRVSDIIGGGTPSTKVSDYWKGRIPWISSSDLEKHKLSNVKPTRFITESAIENSSTHLIPKNSVAVVSRVGVGKLAVIDQEYCTSQDFQSLINIKDDTNFFTYLLYKRLIKLTAMSQGTSIKGITKSELRDLILFIPDIEEQRNIGLFFSKIDTKIQLLEEKVELLKEQKKAYMQKIFKQELRFKNDKGREYPKWSLQKLGNFTERIIRKNSNLETTRPLTISAQHGLIDQVEFFNKTVASNNLTGYYLLNMGEFAYNKSYSNGYPLGVIKRLDNYDNGALSTLYICFTPKHTVNSDFLVHYFDSTQWYKEVSLICVEGARNHGLLNVSVNDFFDTLHFLPCLEEQSKIAKFLDSIDQKITLNEQKLKSLQNQKKAFMQQMFI